MNKFAEWKSIRLVFGVGIAVCGACLRCLLPYFYFLLMATGIGGTKKASERKVWYYPHLSNTLHLQQGKL